MEDPSGLFVSRTALPVSGTCLTVTLEGRRPLLAEVQALLDRSSTAQPRRATAGLDSQRVAMLLAVLQRRAGVNLAGLDCYVSTVGGVKLTEPSTDLAVAMALASAAQDRPLPQRLVCFGEVGLAGEVRGPSRASGAASRRSPGWASPTRSCPRAPPARAPSRRGSPSGR